MRSLLNRTAFVPGVLVLLTACSGPVRSSLPSDAADELRDAARSCDRDEARGCWTLAQRYWTGDGVTQNIDAAVPLVARACAANIAEACVLSEEVALPAEAPEALLGAAQACDRGDLGACGEVAAAWRDGDGVAQDLDHADRLFARTCAAGDVDACDGTTVVSLGPDAPANVVGVARACDEGAAQACRSLGGRYMRGEDVPANIDRGVALWERACFGGDVATCAELGALFMLGGTVAVDVDRAVPVLRRACEAGRTEACERSEEVRLPAGAPDAVVAAARRCDRRDPNGCTELAGAYARGVGVSVDGGHAAELYERACTTGVATACMELGALRQAGSGVAQDALEAARLFDAGCRGGELRACFELGNLYREGAGVPRSISLAFDYWGRACDGGLSSACEQMPGISEVLLPSDASDVHRNLARQCDRATWVSCVELANHYRNGAGVPVDFDEANRLLTLACFNGLASACDAVRFPGPCVATVQAADGALVGTQTSSWDLDLLARWGQIDDPTAHSAEGANASLPAAPRGSTLFEIDERAAWTWAEVTNASFFESGATITPSAPTREVTIDTPRGETVVFTYGPGDRVSTIVETAPGRSRSTTFRWDAAGRLSSYSVSSDGMSSYYDFTYNAEGRLVTALRIDTRGGTDVETRSTWEYDARGNVTSRIEQEQTITGSRVTASTWREERRVFDAAGNVVRSDERDQNRNVLGSTTYEYSGCYPGVR